MSSAPRIQPLDMEASIVAGDAAGVMKQLAELNVFRTLLLHPPLAKALSDLLLMLLGNGNKLSHRAREIIIMRCGWVTASSYEWTQHWRIALLFGMTEEEVLAVRDWQEAKYFDSADRAVLAAADETFAIGFITRKTWKEIEREFPTVEEQLEIPAAIGCWRLISQMARSLELKLEEGVESWPPDGKRPPNATEYDV
jgi:carboxymuconolactone decarboxylase family protein